MTPAPAPPRPSARRLGLVAAGIAAVLLLALGIWRWRDDSGDTATDRASPTPSASTSASTAVAPDRAYGVGRRTLELVDTSRPTDAYEDAAARADRPLPTLVLYPTEDGDADDAPAAAGPFPLVVFSHGSGGNPTFYAPFLAPLVREGYVVALPRFPLTSIPGSPYDDARNQPADVSFVLDSVLSLNDDPSSWLGGRIAADRIAAAGHSLGAVTTIGVTYDACCRDPRIGAALAISGTAVPSGDDTLDDPPPTPLLLVHGVLDDTVPVSGSDTVFDAATGPTYYLRLTDADHTSFILTAAGELTLDAASAFLDAYLRADPTSLAAMPELVAGSGLGEWRTRDTG